MAQPIETAALGAVVIKLKDSNLDTKVTIPSLLPEAFISGSIAVISSSAPGVYNIGLGSGFLPRDYYSDFYYIKFTSGAKKGLYYTITANTESQFTIDSSGDDLTKLKSGDTFRVCKYWTLNTLFPYALAGSDRNPLIASTGHLGHQRGSQIILPPINSGGVNLAPAEIYYFTDAGWVQSIKGTPVSNDVIVYPDSYLIARQPPNVTSEIKMCITGHVF